LERAKFNAGIYFAHRPNNKIETQYIEKNAMRFRTEQKFDLIWSSGLFDYLNERTFVFLLARLRDMMASAGTVVVGNFSENNPDRAYMELIGDWFLIHRSEADLIRLALAAGFEPEQISVTADPTGVNLFLVAGNVARLSEADINQQIHRDD
jgi:extracellular factor (EF) 3-hydroxypalmitic acid methyl ester biosynthesis protein